MVLEQPTALYRSILPVGTDAGNITWTISSNDPPRQSFDIPLLTSVDEYRQLPIMIFNPACRELDVGEYIFNLSYTLATQAGTGRKQYEAGQLIDFTQETLPTISTLTVPDVVEIQQNTNIIDLSSLGLSDADIANLDTNARANMNNAIGDLNSIQALINTTEIAINDNQKLLNEVKKALNAAATLFGTGNSILDKLEDKQIVLLVERDALVAQLNIYIAQANAAYDVIQTLRELVR